MPSLTSLGPAPSVMHGGGGGSWANQGYVINLSIPTLWHFVCHNLQEPNV